MPGLFVIPVGSSSLRSADILNRVNVEALLRKLSPGYDLVVLDAPPILGMANATTLAALADGVLLVIRAGQTSRDAARRAHGQLLSVGAHVMGAVLNDPSGKVKQFGEYYYPYDYAAEKE